MKKRVLVLLATVMLTAWAGSAWGDRSGGFLGHHGGGHYGGRPHGGGHYGGGHYGGGHYRGGHYRGGHYRGYGHFYRPYRHYDHFHGHVGIIIGAPWVGWPYDYAYPPSAYIGAPPVYVEEPPPVYVEKGTAPDYWYYCSDPAGYYPYVQNCRNNWQQIVPTPPSQ